MCRLGKLLIVWQILREPLIICLAIPLAMILREWLEWVGQRKTDITTAMVCIATLQSILLGCAQIWYVDEDTLYVTDAPSLCFAAFATAS
jgi:hypothetical protein